MAHYNRSQMAQAMRAVGVAAGDVVFCHSNVGYFGLAEEGAGAQAVVSVILGAFFDVLGPDGGPTLGSHRRSTSAPRDPKALFGDVARVLAGGVLVRTAACPVPPMSRCDFWDCDT